MKGIVFAFLASGVETLTDGQVIIIRPDVEGFMVSQIPIQAQFNFVAKLAFGAEEISQSQRVIVECTKPDGTRAALSGEMPLPLPLNPQNPAADVKSMTIASIGMNFEAPGLYQFHLLLNGNEILVRSLNIVQIPQGAIPVQMMGQRP